MRHLLVAHLVVAAVLLADRGDVFRGLNEWVEDLRTGLLDRSASGDFVFVAIDAHSIHAVGSWPWSRQIHADILDNLTTAGALDVFFDIDFAFSADAAGDAAFAGALDRSGNAYLPVFQQLDRTASSEPAMNWPMQAFAERSWPALVNVFSDAHGAVRFYPYGEVIAGEYIPSAAALLTGTFLEQTGSFPINFATQPGSVPILSAVDVAEGRFEPDIVAGRSIIVGASAIELGDLFVVPVHGVIPGPLVHVLAAETLAAGIVPTTVARTWVLCTLFALVLLLQTKAFQKPTVLLSAAGLALSLSEAVAFAAFARHAVVIPTAPLYPGLLVFCSWSLLWWLKLNRETIARQRQEVANTSALLKQVFDDSFDAIAILDETGRVQMHSESAARLFSCSAADDLSLPARLRNDALDAMRTGDGGELRSYEVAKDDAVFHLEYTVTPSKTVTFDRNNERTVRIATLSIRDVTTINKQKRDIAYLSSYDTLTGALRRSVFLEFITLRAEAGEPFGIFVFNLSRFKTVNVVLGRDIGDALLQHIVKRVENAQLDISAVARLGGDTFACFTENTAERTDTSDLAHNLSDMVAMPYELENANARVGVRLGYSIIDPSSDFSAAQALSQAEEALDAAKLAGDDAPRAYSPTLSKKQFRSRAIERAMGRALDREEFEVWYQPQHRVEDLELIGSEALLRWDSDTIGQIYPDEFIEIAESTGFINELGAWVLDKAIRDTMTLPSPLGVAVNVSGIQMTADNIVSDISALLQETKFPASRLCLELTETVLFDSTGELVEKMRDIQFRGVCWALDDFGTGYSSLGYISQLPIEKLKVDKSFLLGLQTDPAAEAILTAVSDLCCGLGMTLLCEGVETDQHLRFLKTHRMAEAQGYFFGKPMPFSEYQSYVATSSRSKAPRRTVK
ncbi:EAL domain-containing protein [uncultured Roseobacter sp.]|uniref:EAL domain-containing protein n=1 Tax=uncultured Roseobacter sp. TaxID=114847 RepID=UPI002634DD14|nr:EAL domain-containing protein [uncultured Roseobacter sp.]